MTLAFLYLASPVKGSGYFLVAFIFAFSVVLSHQLATFLAVFILPPFIIVVLIKSRGHYPKALIAALLGGGIAFGIYYLIPILPYLDILIDTIFFDLTLYLYQIPLVSPDVFVVNFGFMLFLSFAGIFVGFFELQKRKSLRFYLLLLLAFLIPLFFSQSYLIGIYLPYHRFVYYLLPPLAIPSGVALSFLIDRVNITYFNSQKGWRHNFLKVLAVVVICTLIIVMVVRFNTVTEEISEGATFYSTTDLSAYQAGTWLRENYADSAIKVVTMQQPGQWFGIYANRTVIAETDVVVEWIVNAESILDLSYEIQHPLTMLRIYETKANISENYVLVNMAWTRLSYFDASMASVSFHDQHNTENTYALANLNRTITLDNSTYPNRIKTEFSGESLFLTQVVAASNISYPFNVTWQFSALQEPNNVKLTLNYYFDPIFSFTNAYIPSMLNWENPWNNPSKVGDGWAYTAFTRENVTKGSYVSVYTKDEQAAFGLKFEDVPDFGSLGVLSSSNIDAIRFEYQYDRVEAYTTESKTYQMLTFSQSSISQPENIAQMNTLFEYKATEQFKSESRDFATIAKNNNIGFVVYDAQRFEQSLLNSKR